MYNCSIEIVYTYIYIYLPIEFGLLWYWYKITEMAPIDIVIFDIILLCGRQGFKIII